MNSHGRTNQDPNCKVEWDPEESNQRHAGEEAAPDVERVMTIVSQEIGMSRRVHEDDHGSKTHEV